MRGVIILSPAEPVLSVVGVNNVVNYSLILPVLYFEMSFLVTSGFCQ